MPNHLATLKQLDHVIAVPTGDELEPWLSFDESIAFLVENAKADSIILHASSGHMFIQSAFVPIEALNPPDFDDLMRWHWHIDQTWGVLTSGSDMRIEEPLADSGSAALAKGEPILFRRSFEGVPERASYFELLQKFTQVSGIHYMPDLNAWCRLDEHGDLEEAVKVAQLPDEGERRGGTIILCARDLLERYAGLSRFTLVRMFDFTYMPPGSFGGSALVEDSVRTLGDHLSYRYGRYTFAGAYARGVQLVPIGLSPKALIDTFWNRNANKQYATFIAYDWRHNRVEELSCAPDQLANYFEGSDKPFETSPVFFRPEVLLKYKSDREKYTLGHRSISCRGSWHLKTFDVNEAGQVHTYIGYLSNLPHEEQLYWKAYNEEPKAGISKRAYRTDFEGRWDAEYDPLPSLKRRLERLAAKGVSWWTLRARQLIERTQYPVTQSADEWAEDLLILHQLVVEGLETAWLRAKASDLGRNPPPGIRSLKLIEECLMGAGTDLDEAREATRPLHELNELRNIVKGHAAGSEAKALRSDAIKRHGSLKAQFRQLCADCDKAIEIIASIPGFS